MLKSMLFSGPSGTGSWIATLGGNISTYGRGLAVSSDGSIYVCGVFWSYNLILVKFNSSGAIEWQRSIEGTKVTYGYAVCVDDSGFVYVCGETESTSSGKTDLLLAKYDSNGNQQLIKTFIAEGLYTFSKDDIYCRSISLLNSSSVYVHGFKIPKQGQSDYESFCVKTNMSDISFMNRIIGYNCKIFSSVISKDNSSIFTCGENSNTFSQTHIWISKQDLRGNLSWSTILKSDGNDSGTSITVDVENNPYICGTFSDSHGYNSIVIAKYSNSGNLLWKNRIRRADRDIQGGAISFSLNEGVYCVGLTYSKDIVITMFNSNGQFQWSRTLSVASRDYVSISTSYDGCLIICANFTTNARSNTIVIKLTNDAIIRSESNEIQFGPFVLKNENLDVFTDYVLQTNADSNTSASKVDYENTEYTLESKTISLDSELYKG